MPKFYFITTAKVLISGIIIFILSGCAPQPPSADLILKNGIFFTVDKNNPQAEAVVVENQEIVYVGNNTDAIKFADNNTEIIDLRGKFGCPGFNDANTNLLRQALFSNAVDLSEVTTVLGIQRKVLQRIRENKNYDKWVIARGWDQEKLDVEDWPSRRILDRIAPYVPMILFNDDGNVALINSQTLRMGRIWASTPDPPAGEILKNPRTGNTTGILKESAIDLVSQFLPKIPDHELRNNLVLQLQKAVELGITSIQDKSSIDIIPLMKELKEENQISCRVSLSYPLEKNVKDYITLNNYFSNSKIKLNQFLLTIDGNIKSRTALLSAPYADKSTTKGISQTTFKKLCELILFSDQNNLLTEIHASGDAAVHYAIQAIEFVHTVNEIKDRRFRLEGMEISNPDMLEKLKHLNTVVIMSPSWCMDAIKWMNNKIGMKRARFAYPFASVRRNGIPLAFGSGYPFKSFNPLLGIYAAVTRKDTTGHPPNGWFPNQRLTVPEAIKAYTLGSAYAENQEKEKGSLEPGKLADIIILDKNILEIPYEEIVKTEVLYTIINGKVVYRRNKPQ